MYVGNASAQQPNGWAKCTGQLLSISLNEALFGTIGNLNSKFPPTHLSKFET
jgi:microcystin-dependent protein